MGQLKLPKENPVDVLNSALDALEKLANRLEKVKISTVKYKEATTYVQQGDKMEAEATEKLNQQIAKFDFTDAFKNLNAFADKILRNTKILSIDELGDASEYLQESLKAIMRRFDEFCKNNEAIKKIDDSVITEVNFRFIDYHSNVEKKLERIMTALDKLIGIHAELDKALKDLDESDNKIRFMGRADPLNIKAITKKMEAAIKENNQGAINQNIKNLNDLKVIVQNYDFGKGTYQEEFKEDIIDNIDIAIQIPVTHKVAEEMGLDTKEVESKAEEVVEVVEKEAIKEEKPVVKEKTLEERFNELPSMENVTHNLEEALENGESQLEKALPIHAVGGIIGEDTPDELLQDCKKYFINLEATFSKFLGAHDFSDEEVIKNDKIINSIQAYGILAKAYLDENMELDTAITDVYDEEEIVAKEITGAPKIETVIQNIKDGETPNLEDIRNLAKNSQDIGELKGCENYLNDLKTELNAVIRKRKRSQPIFDNNKKPTINLIDHLLPRISERIETIQRQNMLVDIVDIPIEEDVKETKKEETTDIELEKDEKVQDKESIGEKVKEVKEIPEKVESKKVEEVEKPKKEVPKRKKTVAKKEAKVPKEKKPIRKETRFALNKVRSETKLGTEKRERTKTRAEEKIERILDKMATHQDTINKSRYDDTVDVNVARKKLNKWQKRFLNHSEVKGAVSEYKKAKTSFEEAIKDGSTSKILSEFSKYESKEKALNNKFDDVIKNRQGSLEINEVRNNLLKGSNELKSAANVILGAESIELYEEKNVSEALGRLVKLVEGLPYQLDEVNTLTPTIDEINAMKEEYPSGFEANKEKLETAQKKYNQVLDHVLSLQSVYFNIKLDEYFDSAMLHNDPDTLKKLITQLHQHREKLKEMFNDFKDTNDDYNFLKLMTETKDPNAIPDLPSKLQRRLFDDVLDYQLGLIDGTIQGLQDRIVQLSRKRSSPTMLGKAEAKKDVVKKEEIVEVKEKRFVTAEYPATLATLPENPIEDIRDGLARGKRLLKSYADLPIAHLDTVVKNLPEEAYDDAVRCLAYVTELKSDLVGLKVELNDESLSEWFTTAQNNLTRIEGVLAERVPEFKDFKELSHIVSNHIASSDEILNSEKPITDDTLNSQEELIAQHRQNLYTLLNDLSADNPELLEIIGPQLTALINKTDDAISNINARKEAQNEDMSHYVQADDTSSALFEVLMNNALILSQGNQQENISFDFNKLNGPLGSFLVDTEANIINDDSGIRLNHCKYYATTLIVGNIQKFEAFTRDNPDFKKLPNNIQSQVRKEFDDAMDSAFKDVESTLGTIKLVDETLDEIDKIEVEKAIEDSGPPPLREHSDINLEFDASLYDRNALRTGRSGKDIEAIYPDIRKDIQELFDVSRGKTKGRRSEERILRKLHNKNVFGFKALFEDAIEKPKEEFNESDYATKLNEHVEQLMYFEDILKKWDDILLFKVEKGGEFHKDNISIQRTERINQYKAEETDPFHKEFIDIYANYAESEKNALKQMIRYEHENIMQTTRNISTNEETIKANITGALAQLYDPKEPLKELMDQYEPKKIGQLGLLKKISTYSGLHYRFADLKEKIYACQLVGKKPAVFEDYAKKLNILKNELNETFERVENDEKLDDAAKIVIKATIESEIQQTDKLLGECNKMAEGEKFTLPQRARRFAKLAFKRPMQSIKEILKGQLERLSVQHPEIVDKLFVKERVRDTRPSTEFIEKIELLDTDVHPYKFNEKIIHNFNNNKDDIFQKLDEYSTLAFNIEHDKIGYFKKISARKEMKLIEKQVSTLLGLRQFNEALKGQINLNIALGNKAELDVLKESSTQYFDLLENAESNMDKNTLQNLVSEDVDENRHSAFTRILKNETSRAKTLNEKAEKKVSPIRFTKKITKMLAQAQKEKLAETVKESKKDVIGPKTPGPK